MGGFRSERQSALTPKQQAVNEYLIDLHVESKTGTKVNFFVKHGGTYGRVCWQADYDGLGDYEKQVTDLQADEGFSQKVSKAGAGGLFVTGHTRDSLWGQT